MSNLTKLKASFIFISSFVLFLIPFLILKEVSAAGFSLTITHAPSQLTQEEVGTVDVSFVGDPRYYAQKTYYLRLVFSPINTTNYFGFTENNLKDWVSSTNDKSQYFSFNTSSEATWSGQVRVKADLSSPFFTSSGDYHLKAGRYTSASDSSADWSSPETVYLIAPTPTPTPPPTPTPSPTPTPTPTPTSTPSPSPSPLPSISSPSPTKKAQSTSLSFQPSSTADLATPSSSAILGTQSAQTQAESSQPSFLSRHLIPLLTITTGSLLLGISALLFFKEKFSPFS